jgi:C4-type Zn-finger protein
MKNKKYTVNQRLTRLEGILTRIYYEVKELKDKQETNNNNDK